MLKSKNFDINMTNFKLTFISIMTLIILLCPAIHVNAENADGLIEAQALEFMPKSEGKFIYCNNTEGIGRNTLAGSPNPNPRYTMNNENLTPDRYYLYLSHINYTYGFDSYNNPSGLGFDVELDVEIKAKEDSVLVINNAACETPAVKRYTNEKGEQLFEATNWGGLNACATMLKSDIKQLHSSKVFKDRNYQPVTINIKKDETVWLSQYLDNYAACSMVLPIFITADTELKSGMVDMNVVELRSQDGKLGDRTGFDSSNIGYGIYLRDRCHKGVADSLPEVNAELEYTIDDETPDGQYLPVTFSNQFFNDVVTNEWVTNLNPQDDIWAKYITVETDMLPLKYIDPYKLTYYGKNVPQSERDDVWIFDTYHSDTKEYVTESGVSADDYSPNYLLEARDKNGEIIDNHGIACSMGNYGVSTRYNLTVTNNGAKTRYFNYDAATSANIITVVRDNYNNIIGTPICKGGNEWDITTDTCASVELKPHETKEFIIETILPVNYMGGLKNSFRISDDKPQFDLRTETKNWLPDYITIENTYLSEYTEKASAETKEFFSGNLSNFEVTETDYGYMLRWKDWDDHPDWEGQFKPLASDVYFLNKNFDLIGQTHFDEFPMKAIYTYGKFIITLQDGTRTFSTDGAKWYTPYWDKSEDGTMNDIMVKLNDEYLKFDQPPIIQNYRTLVPMRYIFEKFGMTVDWNNDNDTAVATDGKTSIAFNIGSNTAVINGKEFETDVSPILLNDRTLIPLRFLSENLGYKVGWNEYAQEVAIDDLPELPDMAQNYYAIYREGYRDNRIEAVLFDVESTTNPTPVLVWDESIALSDSNSKIVNDVKFYLDEATNTWVQFEENYGAISNYAAAFIKSNLHAEFK